MICQHVNISYWNGGDKINSKPKYRIIVDEIINKIRSGEYKVGDTLPSENELTKMFGVSRITVVRAMKELETLGIIKRYWGKGTIVERDLTFHHHLPLLTSFSEDMLKMNLKPSSKTLSWEVGNQSEIMSKLKLNKNSNYLFIKRLRLANNKPLGINLLYVPNFIAEQINLIKYLETNCDFSFYELIENNHIKINYGIQTIRAISNTTEFSKILGISIDEPLIKFERTTFDEFNRVIEYVESFYPGNKYIYEIKLIR